MGRYSRLGLAAICSLALAGTLAGCGDDTPARDAGNGGSAGGAAGGGGGGAAGTDGGMDVAPDGADGKEAGAETGGETGGETNPDVAKPCFGVTFSRPVDLTTLTAADDKDADNCGNGFQYDVQINSDAPDGTDVDLFAGNVLLLASKIVAGKATFSVQLASTGETVLAVQFPARDKCTAASTTAKVTVNCQVPACTITRPTISATHPALNAVPVAQGGDRLSSDGSPYQAAFEVTTDVDDGQPVSLLINNKATPANVTTVSGTASAGKATFAGVTLTPDADYEIQATCTAKTTNVVGRSTKGTYPVNTSAPDLTISKPQDGDFFGPGQLPGGKFQVCGHTTATDAVALGAGLGVAASNFCVALGGSPTCVALTAVGVDSCVDVPCPGGAGFDITTTLKDGAGNPTTKIIRSVSCTSALPSVQIISPVSDAPTFTDTSRHLLAATSAQAFKDLSAVVVGAQADVVACANRAGSAKLMVGRKGGVLTQTGATVVAVAAVPADGCPAGLGFVARFPGATLPESAEDDVGDLATATEIGVDFTDTSTATGSSAPVDLWVDSLAPVVSHDPPNGLCSSFHQTATTFLTPVLFNADSPDITLKVTNGTATDTYATPAFSSGVATFPGVAFDQGQSNVSAVATDRAGNVVVVQPVPCTVTVGAAPVVVFTTPTSGRRLCTANGNPNLCIPDANAALAGWQGALLVHASVAGAPLTTGNITFTSSAGTTLGVVALDGGGNAQLNPATLFDGTFTLTATTDPVPGRGPGSTAITVSVDLGPPAAPTALSATVLDRRQTSFQLSWTAPSDNGGRVDGYEVRYAKVPITALNFDDSTVTTAVPYAGTPAAPGAMDGIAVRDLYIENDYFFAVLGRDTVGNRSPSVATTLPVRASFNVTVLPAPAGLASAESFGYSTDGSGDVNGDGLSDVIVGTFDSGKAYLFLGSPTFPSSSPPVVFTGAALGFGTTVGQIGDIDGDKLGDVAISDPLNNNQIFIFKGRATWPAALSSGQADYVISTDATYVGANFGVSLTPLGDFNGDGAADFAAGASGFGTRKGRVVIILGKVGFASLSLPDVTNSIVIDADPALNRSQFGYAVLGLGHFYSVTSGTTLIVSAPGLGNATSTSDNEGRVYAFHGQSGTAGAIAIASADQVIVGPGKGAKVGLMLTNLGPLINAFPSVGVGNVADGLTLPGTNGTVFLESGTDVTGPLTNRRVVLQGGAGGNGEVMIGGGFPGTNVTASLLGNAAVDLCLVGAASNQIALVDGAKLAANPGDLNMSTLANVILSTPTAWITTGVGGLVRDINGDTYPDLQIGEGATVGRVAVYW